MRNISVFCALYMLITLLSGTSAQEACQLENCADCLDPGPACKTCGATYTENADNTDCISCGAHCQTCSVNLANVVACERCDVNYYVGDEGACAECPSMCANCTKQVSGDMVCHACRARHVRDASSPTGQCHPCPANCAACSLPVDPFTGVISSCDACDARYYRVTTADVFDVGKCRSCPSRATTCEDRGNGEARVKACDTGYVSLRDAANADTDGSRCLGCPCKACSGEVLSSNSQLSRCTECHDGQYVTDAGKCMDCDSGGRCKKCTAAGTCDECNEGFYHVDDQPCEPCPTNCKQCGLADDGVTVVCNTCFEQYVQKPEGELSCDPCPDNCGECTFTSVGTKVCNTCAEGFGLKLSTCFSCPQHCGACTWDQTWAHFDCDTDRCDAGYARLVTGLQQTQNTCHKCPTGCTACEWDDTVGVEYRTAATSLECSACEAGRGVQTTAAGIRECMALPSHCASLDGAVTQDDAVCAACEDGYFLDAGVCNECTPNCKTCTGDAHAQCSACVTGAADKNGDDSDGHECLECEIFQCTSCSFTLTGSDVTATTCLTCAAGYVLADNLCHQCPSSCTTCVYSAEAEATLCGSADACEAGTALVTGGACKACPADCASCKAVSEEDDTVVCEACRLGYGLAGEGGECQACPRSCKTCTYNEEKSYLLCDDGSCEAGTGTNGATCAECPLNSLSCTYDGGTTVTTKCQDRFVQTATGNCVACPQYCSDCDLDGKCKAGKCTDGYARDSRGQCGACGTFAFSNCGRCRDVVGDAAAACVVCLAGYTLKDQLEEGPGAMCLEVSSAACGDGAVVDAAPYCAQCEDTFSTTVDRTCARECYSCGDLATNTFEKPENCPTGANATVMCSSGMCYGRQRVSADGSVVGVAGGCLPADRGQCDGTLSGLVCGNSTADGVQECEKCCQTKSCNSWLGKGEQWSVVEESHGSSIHTVAYAAVLFVLLLHMAVDCL